PILSGARARAAALVAPWRMDYSQGGREAVGDDMAGRVATEAHAGRVDTRNIGPHDRNRGGPELSRHADAGLRHGGSSRAARAPSGRRRYHHARRSVA